MNAKKIRLDVLLHQRGLFPSREAARRAVMAGLVKHEDEVFDKPGLQVREDISLRVLQPLHPYVGRGGLKLEKALSVFPVNLTGRIVVDVGASTGGFTDCALQNGASHVYAVDVGYGQLAWKLRSDARVTVMERTNFRHVDEGVFRPRPSVAVMDVSFISAGLLFPKLLEILEPPFDIISLVKPQFEAGRADVGKGGIVRDLSVHKRVLREHRAMGESNSLHLGGFTYSPVTGGDGNIEYLAWWQGFKSVDETPSRFLAAAGPLVAGSDVDMVVEAAWNSLAEQGNGPPEAES
jgi:23S rRNA (cytidine1920-2'-O)/16S rRNA (cytidine1409-2'-O)-methyltransferase